MIRTNLGQLQPQRHGIVVNAHPVQLLTFRDHPHDHTGPPVQIDPHVLLTVVVCAHRASFVVEVSTPRLPRDNAGSGGPPLHHIKGGACAIASATPHRGALRPVTRRRTILGTVEETEIPMSTFV